MNDNIRSAAVMNMLPLSPLDGHVAYARDGGREVPIAIVGTTHERKAKNTAQSIFLSRALVQLEDKRFYEHRGVDLRGVARALLVNIRSFSIQQGGSTITQQLARSVLNDFRRSPIRKAREAILALKLERGFDKEQILMRYFDEVKWGGKVVGIRAASLAYFGREVERLSATERVALITMLRGPNFYLGNPRAFEKRFSFVQDQLIRARLLKPNQAESPNEVLARIRPQNLDILHPATAELVSSKVLEKRCVVMTTLDVRIQKLCTRYVIESETPTSVVVLRKGVVVGIASTYGSTHAHQFRFNVGSTLKPFLYCFLRKRNWPIDKPISHSAEGLPWNVREASKPWPNTTIGTALIHSWNASFLNATYDIGINDALTYLSKVLIKPTSLFYPASVLGAVKGGLTLFELAQSYSRFFDQKALQDPVVKECHSLLQKIAVNKLQLPVAGPFLKTGTTNNNMERVVVGGSHEITFAILREGHPLQDPTKTGGFMPSVRSFLENLIGVTSFSSQYKWMK